MFTTHTQPVSAAAAKAAENMIKEYRANGGGSNRTNWERTRVILSAILTVLKNGIPVEVSESVEATGSASAYHIAHRVLSTDLMRPYWESVQVVALKNAVRNGDEITGQSDTQRGRTVLICKAV